MNMLEGGCKDISDNVKINISEKKGECQKFCLKEDRKHALSQ
jgi:hypothetical protein